MKTAQFKNQKAFTLIELLVVIGILAVLLAITLIAINPAKQFKQANDTKRRSDVNAILNAINQYAADNKGVLPSGITATATVIGAGAGEVNICSALVTKYLAALPVDPTLGTDGTTVGNASNCSGTYSTSYSVSQSAVDNRVTVTAIPETAGTTISVTR